MLVEILMIIFFVLAGAAGVVAALVLGVGTGDKADRAEKGGQAGKLEGVKKVTFFPKVKKRVIDAEEKATDTTVALRK